MFHMDIAGIFNKRKTVLKVNKFLKLNKSLFKNSTDWQKAGIERLRFNYDEMLLKTKDYPTWLHFGAGNIFRGFIATLQQELLNSGKVDTGIIAVETYDFEIIDKIYTPYDNLSLLVLMNSDGSLNKKVVTSISKV
jgi:fructuronate reductase